MEVRFITTYAISAYHHKSCEFEPRSWWGVLDTKLWDKVCQWIVAGRWLSLGTPVSSTNKTNNRDITEILLKEALNIITLTQINTTQYKQNNELLSLLFYITDDNGLFPSICPSHNPVLSYAMRFNKSNTTDATIGAYSRVL